MRKSKGIVERFQVEPIDDQSCRVTYRMGADFPWFLRPFGWAIAAAFSKVVEPLLGRMSQEAVKRYAQRQTATG